MTEAVRTSEILVNSYKSTRRYNPEDSHLPVQEKTFSHLDSNRYRRNKHRISSCKNNYYIITPLQVIFIIDSTCFDFWSQNHYHVFGYLHRKRKQLLFILYNGFALLLVWAQNTVKMAFNVQAVATIRHLDQSTGGGGAHILLTSATESSEQTEWADRHTEGNSSNFIAVLWSMRAHHKTV
jgi:hypothetical protein